MRLLTEPIDEPVHGESDRGMAERSDDRRGMATQPSHSQPPVHYIQITQEEKEAIDRVSISMYIDISAEGFGPGLPVESTMM